MKIYGRDVARNVSNIGDGTPVETLPRFDKSCESKRAVSPRPMYRLYENVLWFTIAQRLFANFSGNVRRRIRSVFYKRGKKKNWFCCEGEGSAIQGR